MPIDDSMLPLDYRSAGVDLAKYAESMRRLPSWLRRTHCPRVLHREGGFAGLFRLDFPNALFARRYRDPVLVACTDGVGTKLKVAQRCQRHRTVGVDLVAMSVNDALCLGAEPLFFLDYIAMSHDDPDLLEQLVSGISDGCLAADCALLGGETAIMPDLYQPGDYDLAGFCVGVVNRGHIIDGSAIEPGDIVLAVESSGLHSNGYSLARKVVFERAGLQADTIVPELNESVGDALLRPTRIYTSIVRKVLQNYRRKRVVHGIAHITGGGLVENVQRILPANVRLEIDWQSWTVPAVFRWIQQLGSIEWEEMRRVFNLGIGLVLIVRPFNAHAIEKLIQETGVGCWQLGRIKRASSGDAHG